MQEDTGGCHLLQPLAAGIAASLFVLAIVVVAVAEGSQQLLREGTHSGHQRLAEDAVPPQLQLGVWLGIEWPAEGGTQGPVMPSPVQSPELSPTCAP